MNQRWRIRKLPNLIGCLLLLAVISWTGWAPARLHAAVAASLPREEPSEPGDPAAPELSPEDTPETESPGEDDETGEQEVRAIVEQMPDEGLIGLWQIGGVIYETTETTRFDQDYGAFARGRCVEVHYSEVTDGSENQNEQENEQESEDEKELEGQSVDETGTDVQRLVSELETEKGYLCRKPDHSKDHPTKPHKPEDKLFGVIVSFPPGLTGHWSVGGMEFEAGPETKFIQDEAPFTRGGMAKVFFYTDDDDVNYALKIISFVPEVEEEEEPDEEPLAHGVAFGPVSRFPAELEGDWEVGGLLYKANGETKFIQKSGPFKLEGQVRIAFTLDDDGVRIAHEIKTVAGPTTGHKSHATLVGYVTDLPSGSFIGQWQVGGMHFAAGATTEFQEENGLLGVGAYVEVEYALAEGVIQARKIKTHVPPGEGDEQRTGMLEHIGSGTVQIAAATSVGVDEELWRIDGVSYQVTAATLLAAGATELAPGDTVTVNSYTSPGGAHIATSIRPSATTQYLFLPAVGR